MVLFVIDCHALATKGPAYIEEVYNEFHGTLGEAKSAKALWLAILLTKQQMNPSFTTDEVRKALKIVKVDISRDVNNCPYYGGPVIVCIGENFDENSTESSKYQKGLYSKDTAASLFHWLLVQPSIRPHFSARYCKSISLSTLPDHKPVNLNDCDTRSAF